LWVFKKRVLVCACGGILDFELHAPFAHRQTLAGILLSIDMQECGFARARLGPPNKTHPEPYTMAEEQFLAMLRFEQRSRLAELPGSWVPDWKGFYFPPR
jgi:hypothetical protein